MYIYFGRSFDRTLLFMSKIVVANICTNTIDNTLPYVLGSGL
jgi:hypothetical protein